jgi:dihydrofolate synthase/folylpolyglutamate synthase
MGGRLDSTNVCRPLITVITTIGLDHQRILGATPSLIAAEKAGIIKPNVPLICGVQSPKPAEVIRDIAETRAAPSYWLGRDFRYGSVRKPNEIGNRFDTWGTLREPYELLNCGLRLLGRHQASNGAIAVAIAQLLTQQGWALNETAIRSGLENLEIPGRFQVIPGAPPIVLDIAHNELSIGAFVRTLREQFGSDLTGRTLIFSASRDKRISHMMARLFPHFDRVILTKIVGNPRGCELNELQWHANRVERDWDHAGGPPPSIEVAAEPAFALEIARRSNGACRCISVTGSAFLIGEMLTVVRHGLESS